MALNTYGYIANAVGAAMTAWPELLARCTTFDEIPNAPQSGKIEVPQLSTISSATPTDGTPYTNQVNTTSTTLTFVDQAVPFKWPHSKHKAYVTSPAMVTKIVEKARDVLFRAIQDSLVADLIALTPGLSMTLTTGQALFTTDGTEAEKMDNIRFITKGISYLMATNTSQAFSVDGITGLCDYVTWGNIQALGFQGFPKVGLNERLIPSILGVPIFPIQGNTTIDAVSEPTLYLFTKDAIGLAHGNPEVTNNPDETGDDGFHLMDLQCPYAHGALRAGGVVEIASGGS